MDQESNPVAAMKSKYEPPRVVAISLRPEEAVLGHCKMSMSGGPALPACGGALLHCNSLGS
jgi:hypothetical protein